VEWMGEVPGHWEVKRLKQACHVFPSNVDKKFYDGETLVQLCNYTDVCFERSSAFSSGAAFICDDKQPAPEISSIDVQQLAGGTHRHICQPTTDGLLKI